MESDARHMWYSHSLLEVLEPLPRSGPSRRLDIGILCFSYTWRRHILFALTPAYVRRQNVQRRRGNSWSRGHSSGRFPLDSFLLTGHQPLGGSKAKG